MKLSNDIKEIVLRGLENKMKIKDIAIASGCSSSYIIKMKKLLYSDKKELNIDFYKKIISQWLIDDMRYPRKLRHSKKRIHFLLKLEHNYTGSFYLTDKLINEIRTDILLKKENNHPFTDGCFGEAQLSCNKIIYFENNIQYDSYLLNLTFTNSLAVYCQIIKSKHIECILQSLKDIFNYIGKIPNNIIFLNNTNISTLNTGNSQRYKYELYYKFKFCYRFNDTFNKSSSPITAIKLAVQPILKQVNGANIYNFNEYNKILLEKCLLHFNKKIRKYNYTILEAHKEEQFHMFELPKKQLDICTWKKLKTSSMSSIIIDGHIKYFISPDFAFHTVYIAIYSYLIIVYDLYMRQITTLTRKFKNSESFNLNWIDFFPLFIKKPSALLSSELFITFPDNIKKIFETKNKKIKSKHIENIYNFALKNGIEKAINLYSQQIEKDKE